MLIFQYFPVNSDLYSHKNSENHRVAADWRRGSLDPFVGTHILHIILIFGAEHLIPQVLLRGSFSNTLQILNIPLHLICGQFFNVFLLENPFELFRQRDILRVFGVKIAPQLLVGLFQNVLKLIGGISAHILQVNDTQTIEAVQ